MMLTLKKSIGIVAPSLALVLGSPSVLMAQTEPECAVVYVDNTNGSEIAPNFGVDGWESDAHRFLQDALTAAGILLGSPHFEECVEIWLTAGNYRPDQFGTYSTCDDNATPGTNCCPPYGNCNKNLVFNIPNNVTLRGGFAGTELDHDERPADTLANRTFLSGDLKGDDDFTVTFDQDGNLQLNFDGYTDNSRTIVRVDGGSAVLDRLTIRGSQGGGVSVSGGGIDANQATLLVEDCTIERNRGTYGGGVYLEISSLEMRRSKVRHNRQTSSNSQGGGVSAQDAREILFLDCEIDESISIGAGRGAFWPLTNIFCG